MDINSGRKAQAISGDLDSRRRCTKAIGGMLPAGSDTYDRARHLPWLVRAMPAELASADPSVSRTIIARLERTLRAERRRGKAGHWTYDMNRHIALMQALTAERHRLMTADLTPDETRT